MSSGDIEAESEAESEEGELLEDDVISDGEDDEVCTIVPNYMTGGRGVGEEVRAYTLSLIIIFFSLLFFLSVSSVPQSLFPFSVNRNSNLILAHHGAPAFFQTRPGTIDHSIFNLFFSLIISLSLALILLFSFLLSFMFE